MKYDIAVIGHGDFPEGVLSALHLLMGTTEGITAFNLDEKTTHEEFQKKIEDFLDKHKDVLIFADMTGGAPYQEAAQLLLEKQKLDQYIIGSCPLSLIFDMYTKNLCGQLDEENIEKTIQYCIDQSRGLIKYLPNKQAESQNHPAVKQSEKDGI